MKIKYCTELTCEAPSFTIDDHLLVLMELQCRKVEFMRDQESGDLVQVMTLVPRRMDMAAWTDDPDDDGVLR